MNVVFSFDEGFVKTWKADPLPQVVWYEDAENVVGYAFTYVTPDDRKVGIVDFLNLMPIPRLFEIMHNRGYAAVKGYIIMHLTEYQPSLAEVYSWMYDLWCSIKANETDPEYELAGR